MATTPSLSERAAEIGREHREAYRAEFGSDPERGCLGDWDSTGWEDAARQLTSTPGLVADKEYEEARAAYLDALFGDDEQREVRAADLTEGGA